MHTTYRKRRGRARRPVSLLAFIRGLGGLRPDQPDVGDLYAMDIHLGPTGKRLRKRQRLVNITPGEGRYVDDVQSVAVEFGYLTEGQSLIDAIDSELRGEPCYAIQDVDAIPLPASAEPPEPPAVKRGRGRPPKPEGAANCRLDFRLREDELELLRGGAERAGLPVRTFARQCFQSGLAQITGEGF